MFSFLYNRPESWYDINTFENWYHGNISVLMVLGLSLIVIWFIFFIFLAPNKKKFILALVIIFWLLAYLGAANNNFLESIENMKIINFTVADKSFLRLCNMNGATINNLSFCGIARVVNETKKLSVRDKKMFLATDDTVVWFFEYYFYPYFDLVYNQAKTDYVLTSFPEKINDKIEKWGARENKQMVAGGASPRFMDSKSFSLIKEFNKETKLYQKNK